MKMDLLNVSVFHLLELKGFGPIVLKLIVLLFLIVFWVRRKFSYWQTKGLPCLNLNFSEWMTLAKLDNYFDIYKRMSSYPYFCGSYLFWNPILLIRHPELVHQILVKHFEAFPERLPLFVNPKDERANVLINLQGTIWKWTRKVYIPSFASKRMKPMDLLMLTTALKSNDFLGENVGPENKKCFSEFRPNFIRFLLGLTFSAIYALDPSENEVMFLKFVKTNVSMLQRTYKAKNSNGILHCLLPWNIFKRLSINTTLKTDMDFFESIAHFTMKNQNPHVDGDKKNYLKFVYGEMLGRNELDCTIQGDVQKKKESIARSYPSSFGALTLVLIQQSLYNTLYELAKNPQVQQRLRKEIQDKYPDGKNLDDKCESLPYLDKVILESMRKYPPATGIQRVCHKTTNFPEYGLVVEKGTELYISVQGIHNDPRFFKKPEIFNPDRFDNTASFYSGSYIPFGVGPRKCIAPVFSKIMIKNALIGFLTKYETSVHDPLPPTYLNGSNINQIKLSFTKI